MPVPRSLRLNSENVETLQDFADAIYPTNPEVALKFLKGVQEKKFKMLTIGEFAKENNINRQILDAVIRKCKKLGIIYKTGWHDFRWSSVFQRRLVKLMQFYNKLSKKANPYQEVIEKYKLLTKGVQIPLVFEEEE